MDNNRDKFRFTWWNRKINDVDICTSTRDQHNSSHPNSCAHHAAGIALELCSKIKWAKESDYKLVEKQISVEDIIKRCPPMCSTHRVMKHLKENGAKSEDGDEVFSLKDYGYLKPQKREDLAKAFKHLLQVGPFVGAYVIKDDFDPWDQIHLCDGSIQENSDTKPQRHSIAIVGMGIDADRNPFWEGIETVSPTICRSDYDGLFTRIIVSGVDKIFLPIV